MIKMKIVRGMMMKRWVIYRNHLYSVSCIECQGWVG